MRPLMAEGRGVELAGRGKDRPPQRDVICRPGKPAPAQTNVHRHPILPAEDHGSFTQDSAVTRAGAFGALAGSRAA